MLCGRPSSKRLLLQRRPLANECVFFIIRDDYGDDDCREGFGSPVTLTFGLFN